MISPDVLAVLLDFLKAVVGFSLIVVVGYIVGRLIGRLVNKVVQTTLENAFDKTEAGRAFKAAGVDISDLSEKLVLALVIAVALAIGADYTGILNYTGNMITQIILYLPRLVGGILIIVIGFVLASLLATYLGKLVARLVPKQEEELGEMLGNLLLIGLIAIVVTNALEVMLLNGELIYTMILGFVIFSFGIIIGTTIVRNIQEDYPEFKKVAPYARFLIYLIFLMVGVGAIFAQFSGITSIIQTLSWGVAIALALVLIPIATEFVKELYSK